MSQSHPPGQEGREPGRRTAVLGAALAVAAVAFDLTLAGRLTLLFDLAFVAACLALAVAVRCEDFFTVCVLPPLLMTATFVVLAGSRAGAIADPGDGVVQATVTGLSHHSGALVTGYVLCLLTLALRRRHHQLARAQASKRAVSPAP